MNKMEKQQKNVAALLELIKENPTLRIMPMVDTEIVASDDYAWWMAGWGKAELAEIYSNDERVYIRSIDEEELVDKVAENVQDLEELSEEESIEKAKNEVNNYAWEKVIAVRITLP